IHCTTHSFLSVFPPLRSPIPTLFPYTTLFRSRRPRFPAGAAAGIHLPTVGGPCRLLGRRLRRTQGVGRQRATHHHRVGRTGEPLDRKSTRLNSSHVSISYAVFCLKKNNYTIK